VSGLTPLTEFPEFDTPIFEDGIMQASSLSPRVLHSRSCDPTDHRSPRLPSLPSPVAVSSSLSPAPLRQVPLTSVRLASKRSVDQPNLTTLYIEFEHSLCFDDN